jgi:hypothetical protein
MDKQWAAYYEAFRNDAHTLLWRGYLAARHTITAKLEEPAITGLISKAIDEILDSPDIEERFDRYEVHEEKPQNTHGRLGKTRRRTDILIKSNQFRPRRKYIFEAKRLSLSKRIRG